MTEDTTTTAADQEEQQFFAAAVFDESELNALITLIKSEGGDITREIAPAEMASLPPLARAGLKIVAASLTQPGECMVCGCTQEDCSGCIKRTGFPCSWANARMNLCTACLE
jgi:hypothetical protein